jgi:peptidyl-prolyl cis-trans isomerase D
MIRFLQTPGPIKKVVLGGVLLVICGAMVITLVPGGLGSDFGFGGPGKGVVAQVAGQDVTAQDVEKQARQMLQQQLPQAGAQAAMLLPLFATQAAQSLINDKVILAEARHLGLRVNDDEVRDELQHGRYSAVFFPEGKFIGQDQYQSRLDQAGLSVSEFEDGVKDEILFDKLRDLVTGGAVVTDAEIHQEFVRQNTKVKFDYAVLSKDTVLKSIQPSDSELQAFYTQNKASYNNAIPEERKIQYVVLDFSTLQNQASVSRADLESYYDQHRDQYRTPEQVNVRHILIKTPLPGPDGKVDPKGLDAARKKANDILQQLKAGGNFADLAKKYSEDTDSAKNGGSLGWVQRGRFPSAELETAAFSLPKGGTSGVIDTGYGFDIIHVDDKQDAQVKSFDEVKDQIEPVLKQQKAQQMAENESNNLIGQARNNGLSKAAAALGLQVVSTDFVTRQDSLPGIGVSRPFMDAVFAEPANAVDDVQLPEGFAVFDVTQIKPPATPTFEQIRSRVETEFKNQRAAALLTQRTQELSDRAKAEHDLKKAAKELGAVMKTSDFVLPTDQVPDVGAMSGAASVAFSMKPNEISGPIDNGDNGVVLSVLAQQAPSEADYAAKKDAIRDSLLQAKQAEIFGLFVANLRDEMEKSGKIKINQDELKNLTKANGADESD